MMMEKREEEKDIFYSPEKVVEGRDEALVEEEKRLGLLRATLEKKDPSCQVLDDETLRRFLRARGLHVEKASAMVAKYLSWRRTFVPKGSISESEIPNEIAQNKMFLQGRDKKGRPIAVVFGSSHFPTKGGVEEFRRFLVFALDKLCRSIPDGQEKFTIIGDLQGYGYCNSDFRGNLAAVNILQDYYPERLGKVYNIHVPYIFMTMWKLVCPFIDPNTRNKIVFVDNKRLRETLLEDIDECQLPEIYGGKLPLVPIHMAI
ncbi:random slug protein 5 [Phtheirospermum japonicum]|uniref:Random slug protein 5 n=1 Tax=Phtheirospermum japonicum TaxID=374723 RepID=A0A830CNC3_9LAMI|nr:random slug protein 5 [Phtheirospermum japonicum]